MVTDYKPDANGVYHPLCASVDHFPEDIDLFSCMFEYFPSHRPDPRGKNVTMFIDEETGTRLNFEQTLERVELLSLGLNKCVGVGWDTIVGIFSPNVFDYGVLIWAVHRVGGIISAANPSFGASELGYQLDTSKASVLFLHSVSKQAGLEAADKAKIGREKLVIVQDPAHIEKCKRENGGKVLRKIDGMWTVEGLIEEARDIIARDGRQPLKQCRASLQPGESHKKLAFLSFSSGTTGLPKGVAIQHFAPIANVLQQFFTNEISSELGNPKGRFRPGVDVLLGVLPMFHIYALVLGLHASFYHSVAHVIVPKFRGIVPMLETAIKYRCSIWYLVPPQIVLFCKDPQAQKFHARCRDLVNMVMIGAAPLSDDLSAHFEKALPGVDWGQGYGMTETCTLTLQYPLGAKCVLGSAGHLVANVEARIVSPSGQNCGIDQPGEIWIRSPSNTLGYSNNAQATKEMWVEGGWIRTGDEAKVDNRGNFYIVDRLKELIKVKGFQVAPAELEGWLLNHSDVSDAMIVGIPDDEAGERPLAFVTLTSALAQECQTDKDKAKKVKESIMKHVSDHKIRYKHLKRVEIIDAIPKTASGKILRRTGREMAKKLMASEKTGETEKSKL